MAKIIIFDYPLNTFYNLGAQKGFNITGGKGIIEDKLWFDSLPENVTALFGEGFKIEEYDANNPEHFIQTKITNGAFAGAVNNSIVQGPMTVAALAGTEQIRQVDNLLAQAVVTGQVDALIEANPDILADAGFVANTENSAKPAPAKPVLGKSK